MPFHSPHRLRTPPTSLRTCTWSGTRWRICTETEILIDLEEWTAAHGCESLTSYRCALTAELWTLVESVPFAEVSTPLELRLRTLIRAAHRTLERLLASVPGWPAAPGAVADFPFPLRCRSENPAVCLLRLHAEESEGQLFVTIGLSGEFGAHPLAPAAS